MICWHKIHIHTSGLAWKGSTATGPHLQRSRTWTLTSWASGRRTPDAAFASHMMRRCCYVSASCGSAFTLRANKSGGCQAQDRRRAFRQLLNGGTQLPACRQSNDAVAAMLHRARTSTAARAVVSCGLGDSSEDQRSTLSAHHYVRTQCTNPGCSTAARRNISVEDRKSLEGLQPACAKGALAGLHWSSLRFGASSCKAEQQPLNLHQWS